MANTVKDSRLLAALCYPLWPVAVILLLFDRKDPFVRYAAFNSIGLWLGILVLSIAVSLVSWVPVAGWLLHMLFWVAVVALVIVYAIRTYDGKKVFIPVITDFLKKNVKSL